ncbi:MAG: hypothetical protein OEY49_19190 [Candidatus Heimdallarchaeota archaeon]|nr:hypothetical protein [Candidatus Heimdallarchaeota archaeon]
MSLKSSLDTSSLKFSSKMSILAGITYILIAFAYLLSGTPGTNNPDFWNYYLSNKNGRLFIQINWIGWIISSFCGLALVISFYDYLIEDNKAVGRYISSLGFIGFLTTLLSHLTALFISRQMSSVYNSLDESSQNLASAFGAYIIDGDAYTWFGFVGLWLFYFNLKLKDDEDITPMIRILGLISGIGYMLLIIGFLFNILLLVDLIAGLVGIIILPTYLILLGLKLRS